MNDFGFAIWGCGAVSSIHADAITKIDGAILTGATDTNKTALDTFSKKYNVEAFAEAEQLLMSEKTDAVCICLPSGLHYTAALKCIEYKKHIVIEKPISLTSRQAGEIIEAAERNGVFVTVISQLRYSNSAKKIKELVDSGKLGRITLGNAIMKYWRSPEYYRNSPWRGTWEMDGGGALMNQGIHGIDLLQYFMGRVVSVFAYSKTLVHDIQTEDTLTAVLEYENGAIGTVQATTSVSPGYGRRIEICGSEGSVVLCEDHIEALDVKGEEKPSCESLVYSTADNPTNMDSTLHRMQLEDFMSCVRQEKKPFIDAVEGKKSVDIICAIYRSAQTGEKIYL